MRLALTAALVLSIAPPSLSDDIDRRAAEVDAKVVAWRRDIHQHPELGNREVRTSQLVADHLTALGLEVRAGVAHTGVIGILRGGKPGRVVALRADMDALPLVEQVDLPFASHERTTYNGQDVGVMHACGHDNHTAILMGVAEVLTRVKDRIPGTVMFIFQPAEEGAPVGEKGGAELMLDEGAFKGPTPNAVFGLHVVAGPVGRITYHPGPTMASADGFTIVVHGRGTHGAQPWGGIDPIVISAQIVNALQTLVSRQIDLRNGPSVVSVGSINGGVRGNIIPDSVVMVGTIRTFDSTARRELHERLTRTAQMIAGSAGATASVDITTGYPVTVNDPQLTARMLPTLVRVAGRDNVVEVPVWPVSEDFSFFAQRVPGFYIWLGVTPPDVDWRTAPVNHSPRFFADERALPVGVRAMAHLAVDYLTGA